MSAGEHVPGQETEDGVVCPRCECPDVPVIELREGVHSVWDRKRRKRVLMEITRRRRECTNPNCNAVFWTVSRVEVPDG